LTTTADNPDDDFALAVPVLDIAFPDRLDVCADARRLVVELQNVWK
jgi:hypothetical protein